MDVKQRSLKLTAKAPVTGCVCEPRLPGVKYFTLELLTTIFKWMFGETTISQVKVWNHPIETTIYKWYKWLFRVPGCSRIAKWDVKMRFTKTFLQKTNK